MYRVLSIEDTPEEESALRLAVNRYGSEHGIDFSITWLRSAIEDSVERHHFDIIFLDIDLPGISGMDAASFLRKHDQSVPLVFVTNLSQYAIDGYRVDALGYVIKPIDYGLFSLVMAKVIRVLGRENNRSIVISARSESTRIPISELVHIEVRNHDITYHLLDSSRDMTVRGSISSVVEALGDAPFVRVSNSDLVNMAHIRRVTKDGVEVQTGETVFFSRGRKRDAKEQISDYLGGRF